MWSMLLYIRGLQFFTVFGISLWIKRRMIDIGRKKTFYFLQNVWKCTVFLRLHLKFAKSVIMTQNIFFVKIVNMGIKKRRILCWFPIRKNENTQNSHSFLAIASFRDICLSLHRRIWNQHKILRCYLSYFFANIYHSPFDSRKFWNIEAPYRTLGTSDFDKIS